MIDPRTLEGHRSVQLQAKAVLDQVGSTISPSSTEESIAQTCVILLSNAGINETWYYRCPALVLLGSRSCLSLSGRDYRPNDEAVGETNLVTIDLSPLRGGLWGDCARSFVIEGGRWTTEPTEAEFQRGLVCQKKLHQTLAAFAAPERTFEDLYVRLNQEIASLGFENLDFLGNLGHSIEKRRESRQYIEGGNTQRLGSVDLFTFEPHVRSLQGRWGFKHENIYYFGPSRRLEEL